MEWALEIPHCQFIYATTDKCREAAAYRVYDGALGDGKYACRRHLEEMMNPAKNTHVISTLRNGNQ